MKIGNIKLKNRVFLAPMMEVTDLPFRVLCCRYGAGLVYTEMVVANSLVNNSKKAIETIRTCEEEKPVGVQLAGNNKEIILKASKMTNGDLIDLNFGCPSYKVIETDICSALLKKPKKIGEIIGYLVENQNKPVTAKIRLGAKNKNYLQVAKQIEENGGSAICLHGRTALQSYEAKADWNAVKKLKKFVSIPVIGNGDVINGQIAEKLLNDVDFIMIGRGAIGDPFVFDRINRYLKNKEEVVLPSLEEKYKCFLEYCRLSEKYKTYNFKKIKRTAVSFAKNVSRSAKLRGELNNCKNSDEINEKFERFI